LSEISRQYGRELYDALFVALSEMLDAEAITPDEPLFNVVNVDFQKITLLHQR